MYLSEFIKTKSPVILDGAMGTQLELAGLEMGGHICASNPDAVLHIHKQYAKAGCDILTTNTLTMNRISIETHGLNVDVKDVNISGARLARTAAGDDKYVLGNLSSTGQMLEPYGDYSEEQFYTIFKEQAEYLLDGGIDGFIIETVMDLREAVCAVRACRDVSSLPVFATLSFQTADKGGRTIMGNTAAESALALAEAGAAAVGANCGDLDPHETSVIIGLMKDAVKIPLIAQPNAGKPHLDNNKTVFDMTPEEFSKGISECIAAGARLVGGCCGTSPDHIRSITGL